jgi:hypothetical protein
MKVLKVLGWILAAIVLAAGGGLAWLVLRSPDRRPASTETVEATPQRLVRGDYLVHHVSDCLGCHSDFYADRFALPLKPGTEGQGGLQFDKRLGVPGVVQAQNITQDPESGLGAWTDGEILRAIREGVDRNGKALFPMMPYQFFHSMSDEDARSIVAYLRTLRAVPHAVAKRRLDFPVNLLIKFAPKPITSPVPSPDPKDTVAYGQYLVTVGVCRMCHTPHDAKGQLIEGMDYSGGWELLGPWGRVVSSNITPDADNFMGKASREEFIGRFKSFEGLDGENAPVAPPGKNTVMPWPRFAGMTREDLGAIYDS